jgi:methyl coenzyme M reductase subunit C
MSRKRFKQLLNAATPDCRASLWMQDAGCTWLASIGALAVLETVSTFQAQQVEASMCIMSPTSRWQQLSHCSRTFGMRNSLLHLQSMPSH